ncbi:DUF4143 domain-containing protein [Gordonibacter urolithinfaciens]|uniref:DUF4143 domain-containing protein n=1 Tax=Gordonibacter urolithinfaciens TaxID=1335613 RepID=UPI003AAAAE88
MGCHDCGLMAHLARWLTPENLEAGAMGGAFMENFIVSEIRKSFLNAVFDAPLYFYRNRGGKEVDLVLECDGGLYPIEIKKTASSNVGMTRPFATLDKSSIPRPPGGGGDHLHGRSFLVLSTPTRSSCRIV